MMSASPRVSVIIPTYNRARYLPEAIRSALGQTFEDLELLIIDDGSTDSTPELVRAIADPRLRYVQIDHGGISVAMNAGLRNARGSFIARLDSDDVWLPEMLATLVGALDQRPDAGVAYAQGQAMSAAGALIPYFQGRALRFPDDSFRSLIDDDCTCNVALVARRECFERAGCYDESLLANEDWDMWLRVARHYRICFVDRVVVRIRWHGDNFTSLGAPHFREVLRQRSAPLDKLFSDPNLAADIRAMKSAAYAHVHQYCSLRFYESGDFRSAVHEYLRAVRASERPIITALRIPWHASFPSIRKYAMGRRMMNLVAALGHSLGVDGA